jgi:hypothetical protein
MAVCMWYFYLVHPVVHIDLECFYAVTQWVDSVYI